MTKLKGIKEVVEGNLLRHLLDVETFQELHPKDITLQWDVRDVVLDARVLEALWLGPYVSIAGVPIGLWSAKVGTLSSRLPDDPHVFAGYVVRVWLLVLVEVVHGSCIQGETVSNVDGLVIKIEEIGGYRRTLNGNQAGLVGFAVCLGLVFTRWGTALLCTGDGGCTPGLAGG